MMLAWLNANVHSVTDGDCDRSVAVSSLSCCKTSGLHYNHLILWESMTFSILICIALSPSFYRSNWQRVCALVQTPSTGLRHPSCRKVRLGVCALLSLSLCSNVLPVRANIIHQSLWWRTVLPSQRREFLPVAYGNLLPPHFSFYGGSIMIKDTYDALDLSRNPTALGMYNSKALINKIH